MCLRTIPANTGKIPLPHVHAASSWDHPREYGENYGGRADRVATQGPSPRIRGKCAACIATRKTGRTIPANTGKIRWVIRNQRSGKDHPREYGENLDLMPMTSISSGPSPRIRGKLRSIVISPCLAGTIPANTGKISWFVVPTLSLGDHPREYGENQLVCGTDPITGGPSPRIRGKCQHLLR